MKKINNNFYFLKNKEGFHTYQLENLIRILPENAPRRTYFFIPHEERTVIHWGQRKLLMSEIEFLTEYYNLFSENKYLLVYAGSAPGTHIPFLSYLFPNLYFLLYDPAPFNIESNEKITIRNEFFLDETVEELKLRNDNYLFISDIRTANPHIMEEEEIEYCIQKDMNMQMNWVK